MESRNKLNMCRLCLCENECFINIFEMNDWQGFVAAEVIFNLLQFPVYETDGYPHVVCSKCLLKLTDLKNFKECCLKSKETYDNMFVSCESPEKVKPEMDNGDVGSGLEFCERDPLREEACDPLIKQEKLNIDFTLGDGCDLERTNTEASVGPILLKHEVLQFNQYSNPHEKLIESEEFGNTDTVEPAAIPIEYPTQVVLPLAETVTNPKYPLSLENKRPNFTSKEEYEADSCTWSNSTNDELIFVKTENISLSKEVEASSSGTVERLELQRMCIEPDIVGDGEVSKRTGPGKGARERKEGLKCFHCGIVLMSKLGLIKHMKVHGFVNSYDCAECGKVFHFNSTLKRHLLIHTRSKPYKCAECSKSFGQKCYLKTHMRIHTGSKPYKCEECSKCFSHGSNLNAHLRTHTSSKPHKCTICSKNFTHSSTLKAHMSIHTGYKPYKCTECNKTFCRNCDLTKHTRIHTGSKPFKCAECSKSFSDSSTLISHLRTHTGSKPYKCTQCSKCFSQSSTLITHMRLHTGSKPYICTECSKTFRRSSDLKKHMISH